MSVKIALIALDNPAPEEDDPCRWRKLFFNKWRNQASLAVASQLALQNESSILIICNPGSEMEKISLEAGFPVMAWRNPPLQYWRLWRWRREAPNPIAISLGQSGLKIANYVLGRHGSPLQMFTAFFMPPANLKHGRLKNCANFICGSQFIKGQIRGNAAKIKKPLHSTNYTVIAPGIDIHKYKPRATPWTPGQRFIFGMGEALMPDSGALLAVRAMSALWQQRDDPPWELRMFGSGPRFAEIMEEAEKLGVLPRLSILDEQPLEEVINQCHAWLAPGYANDEQPPTLWAGFAAGLPVIASDSALHTERLKEFAGVIRIPAHNPQKLAEEMLRIMRDGILREKLSAQSIRMREEIGLEKMAEKISSQIHMR